MIGEGSWGGGCEDLSEFTCSSGGELRVCVIVCVKLTQRPTLLYCCLSPQQKLSGGDRLAASLISGLFPPLRDPLSTHSLMVFRK